jgi:uncharacterized protein (UPF0276 family)
MYGSSMDRPARTRHRASSNGTVAERERAGHFANEYALSEPYNIGYTVSPPMNEATLQQVLHSIEFCEKHFDVPLLLENPPLYFSIPGSTMTQVEFIQAICARAHVQLLLDLAHFYITSCVMDFDPCQEILSLPLDRVTEVHISGIDIQAGGYWDNHAARAPAIEFALLARVLAHAHVRAITLEYNWSSQFPATVLLDEIGRARTEIISAKRERVGYFSSEY